MFALEAVVLAGVMSCAGACAAADALDIASSASSVDARVWLPRAFDAAPELSMAMTAHRDGDAAAQIELTRDFGAVSVYVGRSQPLPSAQEQRAPASAYASLDWRLNERHRLGVDIDRGLGRSRAGPDRQLTLSHTMAVDTRLRWRLELTRHLDRPAERLGARVGVEWRL